MKCLKISMLIFVIPLLVYPSGAGFAASSSTEKLMHINVIGGPCACGQMIGSFDATYQGRLIKINFVFHSVTEAPRVKLYKGTDRIKSLMGAGLICSWASDSRSCLAKGTEITLVGTWAGKNQFSAQKIYLNSIKAVPKAFFESSFHRVWKYPGGEAKPMKIYFEKSGNLRFEGGFEYFNPARWEYDSEEEVLELYIPNISKSSEKGIIYRIKQGRMLKYDKEKKILYYSVNEKTEYLDIFGWNFFKK